MNFPSKKQILLTATSAFFLVALIIVYRINNPSPVKNIDNSSEPENVPEPTPDQPRGEEERPPSKLLQADRLQDAGKLKEAISLCKLLLTGEDKSDVIVLSKMSILYAALGDETESKREQELLYTESEAYAKKAYAYGQSTADANLAMSVAYGHLAKIAGLKDKISYSRESLKYAEKCLTYDRENDKAHYIIGRWSFEVADMNGITRAMVREIFGEEKVNKATFTEALKHFEMAASKKPDKFVYQYYIGKAYLKSGKDAEALKHLSLAQKLSTITKEDKELRADCSDLVKDLES